MTIKYFSDHAANERTFLAWVRTGIAIMAFGFLVERFDIFLKIAAASLGQRPHAGASQAFGNVAGLTLIIAGAALIFLAGLRFKKIAKAIDDPELQASPGMRLDVTLSAMLIVLGIALVIYLAHALS
jgi:putative membrane protein